MSIDSDDSAKKRLQQRLEEVRAVAEAAEAEGKDVAAIYWSVYERLKNEREAQS